MKIALLLTGQLRTYRTTFKNLKKYIIDPLNPEIFISTWHQTGSSHKELLVKKNEDISEDYLMDFYQTNNVHIENFQNSFFDKIGDVTVPEKLKLIEKGNYKGTLPMYYHMYKGFQMLKNNKFDLIIRMRPDYQVNDFLDLNMFDKKNTLYFNSFDANPDWQVGDKINIGDYEAIKYSCSVFDKLNEYWLKPEGDGSFYSHRVGEKLFKYHFDISNKYNAQPFFINAKILRKDKYSAHLFILYNHLKGYLYKK